MKTIINVSIGAYTLKIFNCKKRDTEIITNSVDIIETDSNNLFVSDKDINTELIESTLKSYLYENKIKKGIINFSLPEYIVKTRIFTLPLQNNDISTIDGKTKIFKKILQENDLTNNEDYVFDLDAISVSEQNNSIELCNIFIKNSILEKIKRLCKNINMTPGVLESEICSLIRLIDMFKVTTNHIIVDIGELYTKVYRLYNSKRLDCFTVTSGVYKIDGLFSSFFKVDKLIAKNHIKTKGLDIENDVFNSISNNFIKDNFTTFILDSITQVNDDLEEDDAVDSIIFCGGGLNIPSLKDTIYSHLREVSEDSLQILDFSGNIENIVFSNQELKESVLSNINQFAVCAGLSLRGGV